MTSERSRFDIFSGKIDDNALWLESAEGLAQACDRMHQIAAEKPGRYFVFSTERNSVLAETHTSASAAEISKAKKTVA